MRYIVTTDDTGYSVYDTVNNRTESSFRYFFEAKLRAALINDLTAAGKFAHPQPLSAEDVTRLERVIREATTN